MSIWSINDWFKWGWNCSSAPPYHSVFLGSNVKVKAHDLWCLWAIFLFFLCLPQPGISQTHRSPNTSSCSVFPCSWWNTVQQCWLLLWTIRIHYPEQFQNNMEADTCCKPTWTPLLHRYSLFFGADAIKTDLDLVPGNRYHSEESNFSLFICSTVPTTHRYPSLFSDCNTTQVEVQLIARVQHMDLRLDPFWIWSMEQGLCKDTQEALLE